MCPHPSIDLIATRDPYIISTVGLHRLLQYESMKGTVRPPRGLSLVLNDYEIRTVTLTCTDPFYSKLFIVFWF